MLTRYAVLTALKQACREEVGSSIGSSLMRLVTEDRGAVIHHGGLTPRVARIVQRPEATVRRHLHAMVTDGQVLKHRPYACTIRWWPVGFLDELRKEQK